MNSSSISSTNTSRNYHTSSTASPIVRTNQSQVSHSQLPNRANTSNNNGDTDQSHCYCSIPAALLTVRKEG